VLTDYNLAGREQEVIDEFPFFSFLLGDVHPHVLALPFVLLAVGLALNLLFNPAPAPEEAPANTIVDRLRALLSGSWHSLLAATGGRIQFLLYAVTIGGLSFLNTWDFPIYLSVVGLAFLVWLSQRRANRQQALLPGLIGIGLLAGLGILLYLPFYATFQSQARGLLPNLWNPTRLPQFFIFFGPFLIAICALLLVLALKDRRWHGQIGWALPLTVLGPLLVMLIVLSGILFNPAGRSYIQGIISDPAVQEVIGEASISALVAESFWRRLQNPWTFLLLALLLGWTVAQLAGLNEPEPLESSERSQSHWLVEKFVLTLLVVGLGLPLVVEFVYLRDNFGIRMNTIFKFYFQAWVLMALVSAFAVYYVANHLRPLPALAWQGVMAVFVLAAMIYPVLAAADKTNYFQNEPTLDGIAWIMRQRPDDYAGIEWLRQHAPDDAVILEAPGSDYAAYQYTGRVSAMTGLPTLLGWGGHQSQWRGNYEEPARREPEIDLIYNTSDPWQAQELLDKYHIDYVYVGPLERERYSPQGLNKFKRWMTVAFQQDNVTIYQKP
jgi:YYY domain-containing protein